MQKSSATLASAAELPVLVLVAPTLRAATQFALDGSQGSFSIFSLNRSTTCLEVCCKMVLATAFKEDRQLTNPGSQNEEVVLGDAEDVKDAFQLRQFRSLLGLVPELPRGWGSLLLLRCVLLARATSLFEWEGWRNAREWERTGTDSQEQHKVKIVPDWCGPCCGV